MSTTMSVVAAVSRAAISAERPTAPAPNTATLSPGRGPQHVQHGADAGLHPAVGRGERGEVVLVGGLDRHDAALADQGVVRQRRLAEELAADRRAVLTVDRGGAVLAAATEVACEERLALGGHAGPAARAVPARVERQQHVIAGADPRDNRYRRPPPPRPTRGPARRAARRAGGRRARSGRCGTGRWRRSAPGPRQRGGRPARPSARRTRPLPAPRQPRS